MFKSVKSGFNNMRDLKFDKATRSHTKTWKPHMCNLIIYKINFSSILRSSGKDTRPHVHKTRDAEQCLILSLWSCYYCLKIWCTKWNFKTTYGVLLNCHIRENRIKYGYDQKSTQVLISFRLVLHITKGTFIHCD